MQNRILLIIVVILSGVLVVVSSRANTTFFNTLMEEKINVKDSKTNAVEELKLEDYIVGVVAAEMPASFDIEALKAQAVAARTYAMYKKSVSSDDFDVVTSVSNQGFIDQDKMKEKWQEDFNFYYDKIKNAVQSTKGKIMTYNDKIVEAYYFAMSNGYTEDVSLVFSESLDYLKSVPSEYDNASLKNFEVTKTFSQNEFCKLLNITCENINITKIERSDTNRVNTIVVNNINFKGTVFRQKLGLRSTDFDIKEDGNNIIITTRGYGHGVGMSQYGANGMAKDGKNYEEILKYYYKNVEIVDI